MILNLSTIFGDRKYKHGEIEIHAIDAYESKVDVHFSIVTGSDFKPADFRNELEAIISKCSI